MVRPAEVLPVVAQMGHLAVQPLPVLAVSAGHGFPSEARTMALVLVAVWQRSSVVGLGIGIALIAVLPRLLFRQWEGLHEQHFLLSMAGLCLPLGMALTGRERTT